LALSLQGSVADVTLEVVEYVQGLILELDKLLSLEVIVLLHVAFLVVRSDQELFNATSCSLELLVLIFFDGLVHLEIDYFECLLALD